jgi:hypothetical protein
MTEVINPDIFMKNRKEEAEEQFKALKKALNKSTPDNGKPKKEPAKQPEPKPPIEEGEHEVYAYTGVKQRKLMVHVMQDNIEVTKPIKKKIYDQKVSWNRREYPIIPSKFVYDNKGVAHQYVETNDVAVLSFNKDHEDKCKKCGGKMTIDARSARELGRRGIFHAIWALDSTHMIMMIVIIIGAMAGAGFGVYFYGEDMKHKTAMDNLIQDKIEMQEQIDLLKYGPNGRPEPQ